MDRRMIPGTALLAVAALWATWPAESWDRLVALLPAATALLAALGLRRPALAGVAASAVVGAPLLASSVVEWRIWASAFALVVAYDALLAAPRREPRQAWVATGLVLAWLVLAAMAAAVWRPSSAALLAPDSLLPGILMLAAAGTVLAVLLVARSDAKVR